MKCLNMQYWGRVVIVGGSHWHIVDGVPAHLDMPSGIWSFLTRSGRGPNTPSLFSNKQFERRGFLWYAYCTLHTPEHPILELHSCTQTQTHTHFSNHTVFKSVVYTFHPHPHAHTNTHVATYAQSQSSLREPWPRPVDMSLPVGY